MKTLMIEKENQKYLKVLWLGYWPIKMPSKAATFFFLAKKSKLD